ncbi:hypothetical protein GCM10009808_15650 [Microbacterium sediminicola]|uniref:Type II secretion system protein GspF domain-containing protein n=1 Tax=Microbacterium sediminicola TaxID=415210 RepID=A0ABP4U5U9_9MICO
MTTLARFRARLRPRATAAASDAVSDAAESLLRISVLLEAGIPPAAAWRHLAALGDQRARGVAAALDEGTPVDAALMLDDSPPESARAARTAQASPSGWNDVAAAWRVATTVGAPLAPTLRAFAHTLADARAITDEVRIALAEPAATARLMGWLPLVGLALSAALGFDPLGVLLTEPAGWACVAAGLALVLGARRWTARIADQARDLGPMPGVAADLMAVALSGGVSIDRARALVRDVRPETSDASDSAAIEQTLELSSTAGVPAADLLRAQAVVDRHRARVEGRMRAATLSTRLLLPLGVCTLPAFLCWGVAPMFLSILPGIGIPTL